MVCGAVKQCGQASQPSNVSKARSKVLSRSYHWKGSYRSDMLNGATVTKALSIVQSGLADRCQPSRAGVPALSFCAPPETGRRYCR